MRKAFTLIELIVAISILSIIMIFLYKSYASLNKSNSFYKSKVDAIEIEEMRKKVIFLDFSLALEGSKSIMNQDAKEDVVFFQSSNSLHKRYNPYITYVVNNSKLYRLESLKKFDRYPLNQDNEFSVDYLGEVNSFRVYTHLKKVGAGSSELFLVHIDFKREEDILLKMRVMNEKQN